jgi:hypothetical protein
MLLALRLNYETAPASTVVLYPDPPAGFTAAKGTDVRETVQNFGITSKAKPYFAMMTNNLTGFGPREVTGFGADKFYVTFAIHEMPVRNALPDEVHVFFTHLNTAGKPITEAGITPNGALVIRYLGEEKFRSPEGVLHADSSDHAFYYRRADRRVSYQSVVSVDSQVLATFQAPPPLSFVSGDELGPNYMLFNGVDGLARTKMSIRYTKHCPSNFLTGNALVWNYSEGAGLVTAGTQIKTSFNDIPDTPAADTYSGANFDLTAQWYDPSLYGRSLPWGPLAPGSVNGAFYWGAHGWEEGGKPGGGQWTQHGGPPAAWSPTTPPPAGWSSTQAPNTPWSRRT